MPEERTELYRKREANETPRRREGMRLLQDILHTGYTVDQEDEDSEHTHEDIMFEVISLVVNLAASIVVNVARRGGEVKMAKAMADDLVEAVTDGVAMLAQLRRTDGAEDDK